VEWTFFSVLLPWDQFICSSQKLSSLTVHETKGRGRGEIRGTGSYKVRVQPTWCNRMWTVMFYKTRDLEMNETAWTYRFAKTCYEIRSRIRISVILSYFMWTRNWVILFNNYVFRNTLAAQLALPYEPSFWPIFILEVLQKNSGFK
jgi:hypothetical protein